MHAHFRTTDILHPGQASPGVAPFSSVQETHTGTLATSPYMRPWLAVPSPQHHSALLAPVSFFNSCTHYCTPLYLDSWYISFTKKPDPSTGEAPGLWLLCSGVRKASSSYPCFRLHLPPHHVGIPGRVADVCAQHHSGHSRGGRPGQTTGIPTPTLSPTHPKVIQGLRFRVSAPFLSTCPFFFWVGKKRLFVYG